MDGKRWKERKIDGKKNGRQKMNKKKDRWENSWIRRKMDEKKKWMKIKTDRKNINGKKDGWMERKLDGWKER